MSLDRNRQAVTLPPLGESKHMGALPPHTHHGAGGSRAPAPGLRKRCMDRGLLAVARPTSRIAERQLWLAPLGNRSRDWTALDRAAVHARPAANTSFTLRGLSAACRARCESTRL
jgi:hypothetical protein